MSHDDEYAEYKKLTWFWRMGHGNIEKKILQGSDTRKLNLDTRKVKSFTFIVKWFCEPCWNKLSKETRRKKKLR